jgi:hypothetical protein
MLSGATYSQYRRAAEHPLLRSFARLRDEAHT